MSDREPKFDRQLEQYANLTGEERQHFFDSRRDPRLKDAMVAADWDKALEFNERWERQFSDEVLPAYIAAEPIERQAYVDSASPVVAKRLLEEEQDYYESLVHDKDRPRRLEGLPPVTDENKERSIRFHLTGELPQLSDEGKRRAEVFENAPEDIRERILVAQEDEAYRLDAVVEGEARETALTDAEIREREIAATNAAEVSRDDVQKAEQHVADADRAYARRTEQATRAATTRREAIARRNRQWREAYNTAAPRMRRQMERQRDALDRVMAREARKEFVDGSIRFARQQADAELAGPIRRFRQAWGAHRNARRQEIPEPILRRTYDRVAADRESRNLDPNMLFQPKTGVEGWWADVTGHTTDWVRERTGLTKLDIRDEDPATWRRAVKTVGRQLGHGWHGVRRRISR